MEDSEEEDIPKKKLKLDDAEANLKNWRLRTIIKENHGKQIQLTLFNNQDERYNNLLLTMGDTQVRFSYNQLILCTGQCI